MLRTEGKEYKFTDRTRTVHEVLSSSIPKDFNVSREIRALVREMDDKEFADYTEMLNSSYTIARDNQNRNRMLAEDAADKLFKVNKARHGVA